MEIIVTIIVISLVVVFVQFTFGSIKYSRSCKFEDKLRKQFPRSRIHVSHPSYFHPNDTSFLVIDFEQKQIVVGLQAFRENLAQNPYKTSVPFSNIMKVEIIKDGTQIATTNRGSQILGAAVGAVALGGVGAVIGGLSASSTTLNGAKRIAIRVTVNDTFRPVHDVTFYASKDKKGGKQGDPTFDQAVRRATEFGAYLDSAIQEAGKEQDGQIESSQNTPVSEQIAQLWQLKQEGALTEEEFEAQKAKLLQS